VTIKTIKGDSYTQRLDYPKGDPREPMTDDDIRIKFKALASPILSVNHQQNIIDSIMKLEEFEDIGQFMELLVKDK